MQTKEEHKLINIHASAIIINNKGVLVRGESGSGKSLLALQCLDVFERKSALVADDRVDISVENSEIYMHTPKNIEGLIELRGRGVIKKEYVKKARLDLIVDLVDEFDRYPEEDEFFIALQGIKLPRCPIPNRQIIDNMHQILLLKHALSLL